MSFDLKKLMDEYLEESLLSLGLPVMVEHARVDTIEIDWETVTGPEKDCVLTIKEFARQLGSDPGSYSQGVLSLTFKNKQAIADFMDGLELLSCVDLIDDVDIEVRGEDLPGGRMTDAVDYSDVIFDGKFEFIAHVYLIPDIVQFSPVEVDIVDTDGDGEASIEDENGVITEVVRKIRVTSKGLKTIKMTCNAGFKWDPEKRSCQKIGGSELATMRKSIRKSVRTKKALGSSFKVRVLRKQRRAKRFRKAMGLDKQ